MRFTRLSLILLAFYFTFIGGSSYFTQIFPIWVAHHVLVTLLVALWLVGRLRSTRTRPAQGLPATGLNTPIYLACGVWVVSGIFALDPRMSLEHLWFLGLHVIMFFVVADMIQRGYQRLIIEALFFMAAGVLFISALELISWYFGSGVFPGGGVGWVGALNSPTLNDIPQLQRAMTVSTLLAGYAAPLVVVLGAWAFTAYEKTFRPVLWLVTACMGLVLFLTSSRGGALSLMAALGTLALFRITQHPRIRALVPPRVLAGLVAIGVVGALAGFVVLTFPSATTGSNEGRLDMWRSAVQLFQTHPITGVGVGMFGRAFREVRDPTIAQDKLASAHNLYLNTLAETGVLGIAVGLLLVGVFLRLAWRNWNNATSAGHKFRIEAAFAALVGMAVHSMVDFFSITPLVLLIVALAAYVIIQQPKSRLDSVPRGARLPALIALVITLIFGGAFVVLDGALGNYIASFRAPTADEKFALIHAAESGDPALRLYPLHAALINGENSDPATAIAVYTTALELEPTWDVGWMNRAALYEREGNLDDALADLATAQSINSYNGATIHWARIAEMTGNVSDDAIIDAYAESIAYQFHIALPLADFWHATPLRLSGLEVYASTATLENQYRIWAVHDPERAATLVPVAPQTAAEWWITGEAALTSGDAPAALDAFNTAIDLAPRQGDYYVARARANLTLDPDAAQRDLRQALLYGTQYEFPNTWLAQLATDPDEKLDYQIFALPIRAVPQEFAAVLYNRIAVFDVLPVMRYPAYSDAQMQPWFDLVAQYEAAGNTNAARSFLRLIYEHDPYNARLRTLMQQLGENYR